MAEKRFSLDVIGVAEPCHEDWASMSGGEQKKFCDRCAKHVHNLSEMSRDEAERFVTANPTGVCIRFHRDAQTGKMLTAEDRPGALASARDTASPRNPGPGEGRFRGRGLLRNPIPRRAAASRRAYRLAGNAYVPFLAVFSLLAGVVAVLLNGGRAPVNTGTTCTMGDMAPPPKHQPRSTPPIPPTPAATPDPARPYTTHMGGAPASPFPQPQPPVVVPPDARPPAGQPVPQIMGLIAPVQPQPEPQPQPVQPPEIMGEIEMIMGDIVSPDEPVEVVEPIEDAPRGGNASQN